MLTAAEIADMRATQDMALPSSCAISRVALTSDGAGGQTESWSTNATVSCRLGALGNSGAERVIAERLTSVTPFVVTLPAGTDVLPKDRIVVDGRAFEVVVVLDKAAWETARRVAVTEVQ